MRQVEAACRLAPENSFYLTTLGVAQYRSGKYPDAVATLTRSDKINSERDRQPRDVSFLAMAHYKLGQKDKAQLLLSELRQLMKEPGWSIDAEARGFLREAEDLLAGKPK